MLEPPAIGLQIVGPTDLPRSVREAIVPGGVLLDDSGSERRLPSFFYQIPSWEAALETRLAPNFGLWELIDVDVREAEAMRVFPRFVPCAVTHLAAHLQLLRNEVGRVVRVAANGGYRSPSHQFSRAASTHCWGTAANIYRIGDDLLDSREKIERYLEIARRVVPSAWGRRYGEQVGDAFDHLHLDLGYFAVEPHGTIAAE